MCGWYYNMDEREMNMKYKVNITGKAEDNIIFDTAREAVRYVLAELHCLGFTVDGRTYEEKFEEITWIGKGEVINA